ncbi:MAG TPA: DNA polymerase IV, partial [Deltaproteobacteria bacterium]|nr:DNA polymerase IV [Deltaproteobacteria bacterium]
GIGKKTQKQLNMMSIYNCGELGRCDEERLTRKFGIVGRRLKLMGQGIDNSPVIPEELQDEVKSVGHSMTLERDISHPDDIRRFLLQLSEMVGSRARRYNVSGKTVSLYIRYADFFTNLGRQTTVHDYINLSSDIYSTALSILDSIELEQPIRLLGISLSNLKHQAAQLPLFEADRKKLLATQAMDSINQKFGSMSVTYGNLVNGREKRGSFVISPAWRPDGIRNVDVK